MNNNQDMQIICFLDRDLYRCISNEIDTDSVILTDKQLLHMYKKHPEAYKQVISELSETILYPDYIFHDKKHQNTGLVVKRINSKSGTPLHTFIVLRVCTDSCNGKYSNSIISGWKINQKRLESYLRNLKLLYKKDNN